ncbi:hypothetical protein, partial [Hymenobacter defluvii]
LKLIKFNPMNRKEYLRIFSQSKAIVDVSNAKQTGMAMRVIDAIGSGKKVLTTNTWVRLQDDYNPHYMHVIDLRKIEIPNLFLENETIESSKDYSIDKWLKNLFIG